MEHQENRTPAKKEPKPWPLWPIAVVIVLYMLFQISYVLLRDPEPTPGDTTEEVAPTD